jgi:hypothetical protein
MCARIRSLGADPNKPTTHPRHTRAGSYRVIATRRARIKCCALRAPRGNARMKVSKIKLHRQTAMTPGQVHVKGGRRREQGALLVARCASSTAWMRLRKLLDEDHPPESSAEPCVSRFSHMVDVHPPDFFDKALSIKTPPRDRRKRRNGRKRPGGE